MANQGWTNDGGAGEQTSSTARQSGRGTQDGAFDDFAHGSTAAHPSGGDCDPLASHGDLMEPAGQLAVTPEI